MDDQTGIRITTRRRQLSTFRDARIEVDGGAPMVRKWGTVAIPLSAGRHVVRCYYPMNFFSRGGDASIAIDVPERHIVAIEYTAPLLGMNPGTWRVTVVTGKAT